MHPASRSVRRAPLRRRAPRRERVRSRRGAGPWHQGDRPPLRVGGRPPRATGPNGLAPATHVVDGAALAQGGVATPDVGVGSCHLQAGPRRRPSRGPLRPPMSELAPAALRPFSSRGAITRLRPPMSELAPATDKFGEHMEQRLELRPPMSELAPPTLYREQFAWLWAGSCDPRCPSWLLPPGAGRGCAPVSAGCDPRCPSWLLPLGACRRSPKWMFPLRPPMSELAPPTGHRIAPVSVARSGPTASESLASPPRRRPGAFSRVHAVLPHLGPQALPPTASDPAEFRSTSPLALSRAGAPPSAAGCGGTVRGGPPGPMLGRCGRR